MENQKITMPADTSMYSAEQINQLFRQTPQVVLYGYTKKEMDTVIAYRRRVNMLREAACYSPIEDTLVEVIPDATAEASLISGDDSEPTGASCVSDDTEWCTRKTIDSDDGFVDSSREVLCAQVSKYISASYVGEGPEEFSRKRKTIDSDEGFVDSSGVVGCVTSTYVEIKSSMSMIDTNNSDGAGNGSAVICAKKARIENCDNEPRTLSPDYFKENISNNVDGSICNANGKLNTKVDERNTKSNVVLKESDFVERKKVNRSSPVNQGVILPLMIDLTDDVDDVEKSSSREPAANSNPTTSDLSEYNHEASRNKSQSRDEAADLKSKERAAGPRSVSTGRTVSPLTCILTRTMPNFVPFSNANVPIRQVSVSSESDPCSLDDVSIYVEKDSTNVYRTKELTSFVSPEFVDCGKRDISGVFLLDVDEEETTGETIIPDVELPSTGDLADSSEKQDVNPHNKKRKFPEIENCAEGDEKPKKTQKKKRKEKPVSPHPESHRNIDQPDLVPDTSEKRDNLVRHPAMEGSEKPQVVQKGQNLPETKQPEIQINEMMPLTNVSKDTAQMINDVPSPLITGHEVNKVQTVPLNCPVPRANDFSYQTETDACLPSAGGQSLNCDPMLSANVGCDDRATSEFVPTLDGAQSQSNMGSPSYSTSNDNLTLIENTNSIMVELSQIIGFIVKQLKKFFVECNKFISPVDNSTALFEVYRYINVYIQVIKSRVFAIHKALKVVYGSDLLIRVLYAITKSVTAKYGITYTRGLCHGILYKLLEADRESVESLPRETETASENIARAPVSQLPIFVRMLELLKEITLVENSNANSIQPESVHPSRAPTTSDQLHPPQMITSSATPDQLQPPQIITSSAKATTAPHTRQVYENNNGSWQFHNLPSNLPQKQTQLSNTSTIPVANIDTNRLPPNHATNPSASFPYRNPHPNNQSTYETSGVMKNPVHPVDNVTSALHSNDLSSQPSRRRSSVPQPTTSVESQNLPQNHGISSAYSNSETRLDIEQLPQKRVIFTNMSDRLRAMVNANISKNTDSSLKQIGHESQQQRVSQIDFNITNGKYFGLPVNEATLQSTNIPFRNPHQEVPQNVSHHLKCQDRHARTTSQAPMFQDRSPQHQNSIVINPQIINPAPPQVPVHSSEVSYSDNTNIASQQNFGGTSGYNFDRHTNPSNSQSRPSTKTTLNRSTQSQALSQSVAPQQCSPASRSLSTNTSANATCYPLNNQHLRLPHNNTVSLNNQRNCNVPEPISANTYNNHPQTNQSANITWYPPNNQDVRLPHDNTVSLNNQRNCNVPEPISTNPYNNHPQTNTSANITWYPPNNQDVRLPHYNTVSLNNQRNCNVPEPISTNPYNNLSMRPTSVQPVRSNSMVSPQQVSQYNQTFSKEVPNTVAYAVRESHQYRSNQSSIAGSNMNNPEISRTTQSSMSHISNYCGVLDTRAVIHQTPTLKNLLTTDMASHSKAMQQSGSQQRPQITVREFAKTTAPSQFSLSLLHDTRGNHIPPSHEAATRCTDSSIAESHLNRMQSTYTDINHHSAPPPTYSYLRSSNSNVQYTSTTAGNVSRHNNPSESIIRRTVNPNFAHGTSTGAKGYNGKSVDQATISNRRMSNAAHVQSVSADPVAVNGSVHQSLRGHAGSIDRHNMPATGNFQPLSRQLDTTGSCQNNKSTSGYRQPPTCAVQPPAICDQGSWNPNTHGNTEAYRVAADEVEVTSTLTRKSLHSSHHSLDSGVGLMSPTTSEACSESPGLAAPLAVNETTYPVAAVAKTRRRRKKITEPSHDQDGSYGDDVLRCVCCKKEANVMCSGCKSRFYCTYECQKTDWVTIHNFVCGK